MKYIEALDLLFKVDGLAKDANISVEERIALLSKMKEKLKDVTKYDRTTDTLDKIIGDHDVNRTLTEYLSEVEKEASKRK